MSPRIRGYLNARGVTDESIARFGLSEVDGQIAIPVTDRNGVVLFRKYRRDPDVDSDAPKYRYDAGSKVALFNPNAVEAQDGRATFVFVVEGELDVLALESLGIRACTSTGGAMSFQKEWAPLFEGRDVIVCLDNDEAGIRGMVRIQRMIPHARLILLPSKKGVKDVTDYLMAFGVGSFLALESRRYVIPEDLESPATAAEVRDKVRECGAASDALLPCHDNLTEEALRQANEMLEKYRRIRDRPRHPADGKDDIERAKQYPIDALIQFNRAGYARCPWHEERSPSLYLYRKKNRAHCFGGCGKGFDPIDAAMQSMGMTFRQAVDYLTNKIK